MLLFVFCFVSAGLAVDRVHLLDVIGANMLFRGGSPEVNRVFNFSALVSSLRSRESLVSFLELIAPFKNRFAAQVVNTTFPSKFSLIVINVENLDTGRVGFSEGESKERQFFWFSLSKKMEQMLCLNTPSLQTILMLDRSCFGIWLGRFRILIAKSSMGTEIGSLLPTASGEVTSWCEEVSSLKRWSSFFKNFLNAVELLRSMMLRVTAQPTVIYFHCDCGCDRTGQLAGGYSMRFLNATWDEVFYFESFLQSLILLLLC